jgi:hypothetical protein
MLYGCELWLLNKAKCVMLEKCQNVFLRVTEGFLPGTSGSAARVFWSLWTVEGVIEKKKLEFLGRIINSSQDFAQRKLLMIQIVRWKYRRKISTGFVADVMRIMLKHSLWPYIEDFLDDGAFSTYA